MTAKLTFCGAARGVTGSCYHLATPDGAIVIDCGTFQGGPDADAQNRAAFPFEPKDVLAVVLTHGHLDHVGRVPLLFRGGFEGPVVGHRATLAVAQLIMRDAAKVAIHAGTRPLYGEADVEAAIDAMRPLASYAATTTIGPFTIQIFDAGHILGSSSVRVSWHEAGTRRAILFSGDLGVLDTPILRDPHVHWDPDAHRCDFVVTESTYGTRAHPGRAAARQALRDAVLHAVTDGGKVLIPAFAIGRTQELLYELNWLVESGQLSRVPVVVDGPLGLDATQLYDRFRDCYDDDALSLLRAGDAPLEFDGLYSARTGRASHAARDIEGPAIIIAGSGMCTGGRIRGYLAEHLSDPRTDLIFVGYQAHGTLGRELQRGAQSVAIDGQDVPVRAAITTISGFSAHADSDGLAAWLAAVPRTPGGAVFVTHGEEKAARGYARRIKDQLDARTIVPALGDTAALTLRP